MKIYIPSSATLKVISMAKYNGAVCPEHPKRDHNLKFTPLSETTSIPTPFICGVPPPPGIVGGFKITVFERNLKE